MIKKLWQYQASLLVRLLNEARMVYSMNFDAVNDYVTILYQFLGLIYVGQDDNTGVQVGLNFPISSTAR